MDIDDVYSRSTIFVEFVRKDCSLVRYEQVDTNGHKIEPEMKGNEPDKGSCNVVQWHVKQRANRRPTRSRMQPRV